MPVVDERRIAKAKALRAQGMTQEEIAVELGSCRGRSASFCASRALAGASRWRTSGGEGHDLPTKLAIIGLGVTVLLIGVAALILWRS